MIITFCGHKQSNLSDKDKYLIEKVLRFFLLKHPESVFYLSSYGEFDNFCNNTLIKLKKEFRFIKRILVLHDVYYDNSYYRNIINYDQAVYPFSDSGIQNSSLSAVNKWMIDISDLTIAFVNHESQVASKMLDYAKQNNKACINIGKYK